MLSTSTDQKPGRLIDNLRVGKPEVEPSAPAHQWGIRQGNQHGSTRRAAGIEPTGPWSARGTAARSTGINPEKRNPIDPSMPNLSPA
jgi:hypothetical protein